jgi:T5SS/PEP-CTERM-associated repeat protein/autotransporter-associated beta strand protein
LTNSRLYIGNSGKGTLNITNGGIASGSIAYLGYNSGSTGTAIVDGAGSALTNSSLYIGNSGKGTLNITNGGIASGSIAYLGYNSGSAGTVIVDGTGSTWTISSIYIGYSSNGTLEITNGGNVSTGTCWLGYNSGSTGSVYLNGNSTWSSSYLNVGHNGTGNLTQSGGTNLVSTNLYLGNTSTGKGTYNLDGGTLILKSLSKGSGIATFNFGGGTLQASGNLTISLPMTLTGEGGNATINTAGYNPTLSGILSGIGGLNKTGAGILGLTTSNTYTGPTTISNGTLKLASSGAIASTSIIDVEKDGIFDVSAKNASGGFKLGAAQTLKGSGKVLGNFSALAGSHITPGDSAGVLNVTGNLSLTDGAFLDFELGDIFASDKIFMPASILYLNGQDFADFHFTQLDRFGMGLYTLIDAGTISGPLGSNLSGNIGSYTASLAVSGNDLVLNVVPEPSSLAMMVMAALGLGVNCLLTTAINRWAKINCPRGTGN